MVQSHSFGTLTRAGGLVCCCRGAFGCGAFPLKMNMKFAASTAVASFVTAAAMLLSSAPPANAVSYATSGFSLSTLGDTIGSQYDQLSGSSVSGAFVDGQTINLNLLSFTAGVNATVPQYYPNKYAIAETITIGSGTPQAIQIPFNLDISYSDTLTVVGGTTFSFLDAGSLWQIVVNGLTIGPNPGGTMTAWLTAKVTDPPTPAPLPAALPLFASGLGGMGLLAWWRKRKNRAAQAA
jgi:hypothetical protein